MEPLNPSMVKSGSSRPPGTRDEARLKPGSTEKEMRTLIAAGIVALVAIPAAAQSKETERVDRTIPFQSGGTIILKNFSGDVRINGTSTGQVVLKAVRTATRERLDRIKLDIRVDGTTLRIDANKRDRSADNDKNNVVETDFELSIPAQTNLEVDAFSSDVTIDAVEGRQKLHTFSGAIVVTNGTGPFSLNTFSGSIDVDVTSAAAPEIEAETFSGDIEARVPGNASGEVEFSSFSGGLSSDVPLTLRSGSKKRFSGTLNAGGRNELRFKTFSGDVRIKS
jgi:DUF4097 and DUF4098 domain-containing protein YvlB